MIGLAWFCLCLSAIPLFLLVVNLPLYRAPRPVSRQLNQTVSILIPARNEESNIQQAITAALNSTHVSVEVLVLDDGSTDRTAELVTELAQKDARVKLVRGVSLPLGWGGKPHACARLAEHATGEWLLFQDADVRINPDAVARLTACASERELDLLSGIPHQITKTWSEKLIVPVIHFVLLGYLPMPGVRWSGSPAFAAAVGQLLFVRREAYVDTGGHSAIRARIHDGMAIAQNFRSKNRRTDLVDLTPLASCRMYSNVKDLWGGFAKNVHEGMGSPRAIGLWSTLLLGGHVLPWLLWPLANEAAYLFLSAIGLSMLSRILLTLRFRQSLFGTLTHPMGVAATVAIQWYGLTRWLSNRPIAWKGRVPS